MSFRDNLQHLRASRNMTQEQLAMLLGVSRQSVTKWEAEKSYPEMDKLLKMCQIFDCTLDDLVQGDLTSRAPEPEVTVPAGPPTDVCGYDEHQRMMAWKVPTGIAAILLGIAIGLFFEGAVELASVGARDGLFVIIVLAGVLAGLAFLIPAGMEHAAFQRAHPYVEDFYTEDDRLAARKAFSGGLIAGIAFIFAGIGCLIMLEKTAENIALFFLMFFIALGVWNITHYGMLLGRIDVAEYNRSVGEELEVEEIVAVELDDARREALLATKRADRKIGAICGAIMIVATIVGLGLLFAPVLTSANPDEFEPLGTSAAWFWVTWPVGGMICGIVTLLMRAFGKDE
ncbi:MULTISPECIES: helix-turn-helix transcriptional regulator [Collinsella]|uniref:Helix-turn-helix transcriptional regulator n=1 Tax=Collinsella ihumii TaxID=1720204 RepID=A0ABT7XDZ3_9ACTN|nr:MULTISPECIES: helix-turn-helix transcriptional regulator [Collinsella]MBM6687602.1 helix-turn-helix transcriptional regulator [Collinsella tanakaei]MCF6413208.1 helix-turn-helix transcriptional regulator [Collinsella tanakaei]MDN0063586.1 helix-turn-helix transcriptional regulator [Collinsella ihumii]OUO61671.1 Cro/Cl family transcriptional regulator [Collinsella sp. An271]